MGRLMLRRWINLLGGAAYAVWLARNGQYAWVGNEKGAILFDLSGDQLYAYPGNSHELPIIGLAAKDDLSVTYVCARDGSIRRLSGEIQQGKFVLSPSSQPIIYRTNKPDLHSIAYAADAGIIAVGHLSAGIATIGQNDEILWQQHALSGNATDVDTWIVTLDARGQSLYAGSSMPAYNYLISLDPQTGQEKTSRFYFEPQTRITSLSALSDGKGVLAALAVWDDFSYSHVGKLVLYSADLASVLWEKSWTDTITAVCTDDKKSLIAVASGFNGDLVMLSTGTGNACADNLQLNSLANQISLTQGRYLAVATQDGHLAFIQYLD